MDQVVSVTADCVTLSRYSSHWLKGVWSQYFRHFCLLLSIMSVKHLAFICKISSTNERKMISELSIKNNTFILIDMNLKKVGQMFFQVYSNAICFS